MDLTAVLIVIFGLQQAVTITVAAQGELVTEKSGILNIGLEGVMLMGAFTAAGVDTAFQPQFGASSALVGLLCGMLVGVVANFAFAVMSTRIHVDQVVAGIGVNIFALGITYVLSATFFNVDGTPRSNTIPPFFHFPGLPKDLGAVSSMEIVMFVLPVLVYLLLSRTTFGLHVRATGENPKAAEAAGLDVAKTRILATALGGALLGMAGGYITVSLTSSFVPNITQGIGFIALAAVIAGAWNPFAVLGVGVLFGVLVGSEHVIQVVYGIPTTNPTYVLLNVLPYAITVLVLALASKRLRPPAALALPYKKE